MRLAGRVLAIAGSDSSGGAGVQADIKTITALGAYACTAITAITVQDTVGVYRVHKLPAALIAAQIACALADPGADAIKTGMLVDAATIAAVADVLAVRGRGVPLVIDPVMLSTSGTTLLDADAIDPLRALFAGAALITPNAPEAAALTGRPVADLAGMRTAARSLLAGGVGAVLVKGAHAAGDSITDLLLTADGETLFTHARTSSRHTHGTGCTLASAIAAGLAQGLLVQAAIARAEAFVQSAIAQAPGFGAGHGPLNHAITVQPFSGLA